MLGGREYLQRVRPEAMGHLLAFFKEAGRHLDPKTRFLISVLKQVVNFSPRGLRQYISRARQAGATRDEILDTILLAYPLANLTRLADATDILLDMERRSVGDTPLPTPDSPAPQAAPEGEPDSPRPKRWYLLRGVTPPDEGQVCLGAVMDRELLITRHAGRLHALDNNCPHQGGRLHRGSLSNGVVTCPLHGWRFDVTTGACAGKGLGGATVIDIRLDDQGQIEVCL